MNRDLPREAAALNNCDLQVGYEASFNWFVDTSEIDEFSRISGDINPLHMSDEFAKSKGFEGRVAHGFLLGAKVSALVGMLLPGRDCLILEQRLSYPKPIYPGDLIRIDGSVSELSQEQRVVKVNIRALREGDAGDVLVARGFVLCRNQ